MGVVDPQTATTLDCRACNPLVGRHASADETRCDLGILLVDVGEKELVTLVIDEEHRRPLGVEHFAGLGDDQGQELIDVEPRGKGAAELVEEA